MSNHSRLASLRRPVGSMLAVSLAVASACAAWQALPAQAAPLAAQDYSGISFRFRIAGHDPAQVVEIDAGSLPAANAEEASIAVPLQDTSSAEAAAVPPPLLRLYQPYGQPAHLSYGAKGDRREISLTAEPEGDAVRVRVEFTRRGERAAAIERVVADGESLNLKDAAGQVQAVLGGIDDVTFTLARARTEPSSSLR